MNIYSTLYLVRHGQAESNVLKITGGHRDYPLTAAGEKQAEELGEKLKHIHFDAIFSSDLTRAKRTAEIATLERKLAITTTELLRERNFGDFEGKSHEELFALWQSWKDLTKEEKMKVRHAHNSENDEELLGRFIPFIRELAVTYLGKTVLVTTHGGPIFSFLNHLGAFPKGKRAWIGNTAYVKLLSDGVEFEIQEMEGIKFDDKS